MTRHKRAARKARKSKVEANTQMPQLWPDRALILSRGARKLVGKKTSWLINALVRSAELGQDGQETLDRGTVRWGKNSLSWEMRTYDQHLLYRDFDNQIGEDKTQVIFVLTAQEASENLAQQRARLAALGALY